jgi:hypothetical protein
MLRINITSTGPSKLNFNKLEKYSIPSPPNGFEPEENNEVIVQFEDEQQAIDYSHELDEYAESVVHTSTEYMIVTDIINAISNDEFVRAYIYD